LRVLVTGGVGFIGSHLVDKLVDEGCRVRVLDDLSSGDLKNIWEHVEKKDVEFVEGSVLASGVVERVVDGVDAVVHLAAVTSVPLSVADPGLTFKVNVEGTRLLLQECALNGVQRFLLVSSCAVYGEPRYLPTDEFHPTNPMSPYAWSKLEAETAAFKNGGNGLSIAALRLFNVYGSRQPRSGYASVISSFSERLPAGRPLIIYGDGRQTRDFVHVSDATEAMWLALKRREAEGIFNVASGSHVSIKELAHVMAELADIEDPAMVFEEPREGDIRNSQGDYSKAKEALGYEPKTDLQEGLGELLADVEAHDKSRVQRAVAT